MESRERSFSFSFACFFLGNFICFSPFECLVCLVQIRVIGITMFLQIEHGTIRCSNCMFCMPYLDVIMIECRNRPRCQEMALAITITMNDIQLIGFQVTSEKCKPLINDRY
jgi:hypothetical protein